MDKRIIIPIDVYKRIEPWLIKELRYDRDMLDREFNGMIDTYLDSEDYPQKGEIPTGDFDTIVDFALKVSDNIVFDFTGWYTLNSKTPFMRFSIEDIAKIWDEHIKKNPNYTEADIDIYYSILFLTGLYLKHKATKGMFDFEYGSSTEKPIKNNEKMRPENNEKVRLEMLEVYKLFHADKQTNNRTIRIDYKGDTLRIKNTENWFITMLNDHFKDYLHVNGYEGADRELAGFDPYYTSNKKGRKADTPFLMVTISLYQLLKHLSFSDKGLTNDEGRFILDYLILLDVIEEETQKDDILNLRATINNLLKKSYTPQWWNEIIFT